jgi:membrane protein required for colicin V production
METLATLSWLDWTLLVVLVLSVIVGLVRGFVFEVMSLAGWVVAWFAALWGAPLLAPHVPVGSPGSALNMATCFALCFIAAMLIWSLIAKLVRMLVRATPLSLPDRALGAGFGLVRGAILLLAVATVVALTPAVRAPEWRASHGATWLMIALQGLKPLLPSAIVERLPS